MKRKRQGIIRASDFNFAPPPQPRRKHVQDVIVSVQPAPPPVQYMAVQDYEMGLAMKQNDFDIAIKERDEELSIANKKITHLEGLCKTNDMFMEAKHNQIQEQKKELDVMQKQIIELKGINDNLSGQLKKGARK